MEKLRFNELVVKGKELVDAMELKEALNVYQNWLKLTGTNHSESIDSRKKLAVVYNNMGQIKYLQVDFDGAVQDYSEALRLDPELASAYYNRGTIMYRMGCFQKAMEDLQKAVTLRPDNEEFQLGLQRANAEVKGEKIQGDGTGR